LHFGMPDAFCQQYFRPILRRIGSGPDLPPDSPGPVSADAPWPYVPGRIAFFDGLAKAMQGHDRQSPCPARRRCAPLGR
jgi:hypothetical protein